MSVLIITVYATGVQIAGRRLGEVRKCHVSKCHSCFSSALTCPAKIEVWETFSGVHNSLVFLIVYSYHKKKNLVCTASALETRFLTVLVLKPGWMDFQMDLTRLVVHLIPELQIM